MNAELLEALDVLEKEKNISRDAIIEAIENSLITAYKNPSSKNPVNVSVSINETTGDFEVVSVKDVVEEVEDPGCEISLEDALKLDENAKLGGTVSQRIDSKDFGRIATNTAKNVILQKLREEERSVLYNEYKLKEREVVTGVVQRKMGKNISVNLGKMDGVLNENEMIQGENLRPQDRVKVFILEVRDLPKGPRIYVSRTHPELVRRLFEAEVAEVADGIVEIMGIAREAGSRTKIAVRSNDENVDPVGACVGLNGSRVNSIVNELHGEKIDIVNWQDNPAMFIENALSPAKVIYVIADADEKSADVVVPDYQLSLAIGKEGQNARLAARLTGYKIDIKSESQAKESGDFIGYDEEDYENYSDSEQEFYDEEFVDDFIDEELEEVSDEYETADISDEYELSDEYEITDASDEYELSDEAPIDNESIEEE